MISIASSRSLPLRLGYQKKYRKSFEVISFLEGDLVSGAVGAFFKHNFSCNATNNQSKSLFRTDLILSARAK